MNKRVKILILFITILTFLLILPNIAYGKSYKIENMDIRATILENGDVEINQTLLYNFKGDYNGIYIDIPYKLDSTSYDAFRKQSTILNDSLYNNDSVIINSVSEIIDSSEKTYTKVTPNSLSAHNGNTGVYTVSIESGIMQVKVYSPAQNENKTFNINYVLKNTCVKHNDIGELYYNFIGGNWKCKIEKLNIDIFLPVNKSTENLRIYAHGPYNGVSKIISKNQINLYVEDVKPQQYVAARVIFDLYNINTATKSSNLDALNIILEDEDIIVQNQAEKDKFTNKIMIFAFILFGYWIILLLIYEKDKKYLVTDAKEDELFEKYNPLLAGCIQGNREILARDIIAVILNLVNKKIIELESIPVTSKNIEYRHFLKVIPGKELEMDEIEKYVFDWVFNGEKTISLNERLKELPNEATANHKFKVLNEITKKKLNNLGANKSKVPFVIKFANTLLFIMVITHFQYNKLNMYSVPEMIMSNIGMIFIVLLMFLPLVMGILYVVLNIFMFFKHTTNKLINKITNHKVISTTITIIILFIIILAITYFLDVDKFIIVDEILICISVIILLTDNLMLKNEVNVIEDYSRLNLLKYKIQNTLMNTREIQEIVLWEKYLTYAISFGTADKISNKIKDINIDGDTIKLLNNAMFMNYIYSDYYDFYLYASLDRRFMRAYRKSLSTTTKVWLKAAASAGSSSGRGGGFSGGGRILWWRRTPEAGGRCFLTKK